MEDATSESGDVFLHSTTNQSNDLFWVGPYVFLTPGDYEATYRLKVDNTTETSLLDLYVSCFFYKTTISYVGNNATGYNLRFGLSTDGEQNILTSLRLNGSDFSQSNRYQDFTLKFHVSDFGAYEFRGTSLSNSSNVYFDGVRVVQAKPLGTLYLETSENYPEG